MHEVWAILYPISIYFNLHANLSCYQLQRQAWSTKIHTAEAFFQLQNLQHICSFNHVEKSYSSNFPRPTRRPVVIYDTVYYNDTQNMHGQLTDRRFSHLWNILQAYWLLGLQSNSKTAGFSL